MHRAQSVAMIGEVAAPEEARSVYQWEDADCANAFRPFDIASRTVLDDIEVQSAGLQRPDRTVEQRYIRVQIADAALTPDIARQLAAALIEAADELDRLGS